METLFDYFHRIAMYDWWRIVIELICIGLVVYWAVNFLEDTRGERLFRGVIFILIAGMLILNLLVDRFKFPRLEFLYGGFLIFVLIVAVAAFQPEIRRALIRIGQPSFMASSSQKVARSIEAIIDAVTRLSDTKTGAIIVIEKKVALGEFIETGTRIDATVSSALLRTIFRPDTALHDMAVVIRNDRIIAAHVQLPLAEAASVHGIELGSRHRAAIGITTGSDAICLVVSEETGIISIAEDGKLNRHADELLIRRSLSSTMREASTAANVFPTTERRRAVAVDDEKIN